MGLVVPALGPGLALDHALAPKAVLAIAAAINLEAPPNREADPVASHRAIRPIAANPAVALDPAIGNAKTAIGRNPPLRPIRKSRGPDLDPNPVHDPLHRVESILIGRLWLKCCERTNTS